MPSPDLPLFTIGPGPDDGTPGPIESAVETELQRKIEDGILDASLYAAQIAQARVLAREVDRSVGQGRPSGRAQIHDVLHRLLIDLPQPERVSSSDLDKALEAILSPDAGEAPSP